MGHADLQVLQKCLTQTSNDVANRQRVGSLVDSGKGKNPKIPTCIGHEL